MIFIENSRFDQHKNNSMCSFVTFSFMHYSYKKGFYYQYRILFKNPIKNNILHVTKNYLRDNISIFL